MAKIEKFEELPPDGGQVHGPVLCGWKIFEAAGKTHMQLDTYGSDARKLTGKVSQSIQFDRASAAELLGVLRRAFPSLFRVD